MTFEGDELVLSSGRRTYAFGKTIGIGAELEPTYGWDGAIDVDGWADERPWTHEERAELADYMISLWTRFKEQR